MPLTPATTDKFTKVGSPGSATTLAAPGYTIADAAINVGSTTNWQTETLQVFAIDRAQVVNGAEARIAGTYNEFVGIVTGATTIGSLTKRYGTAQNYAAGSLTRVYIPVSSTRENDVVDGLAQDHNLKGNHKTLTDDNGNEWLERNQVASAVNQVKISNSATGNAVKVEASGDDTNVGLQLKSKGTGDVELIPASTGNAKVDGSVPKKFFALFDFVESGIVITADSVGVNKNYSISSGVVWIGGKRLTVAAVSAQTVGASKDRYIDLRDNGDGTAVYITNEVANNAASQALTAGDMRVGIVVAGATTIATTGSLNQGQFSAVLPIASSIPYTFTDSLGNIICPRDANRRILGYRQITSNFGHSATIAQVTGLTVPVIIPVGGSNVELQFGAQYIANDAVGDMKLSLWDGAVSVGTQIAQNQGYAATVSVGYMAQLTGQATVTAGLHTFNAATAGSAGNSTLGAAAGAPAFLIVRRG